MTRQDIERDYRVENGRIASPGKFEGELVYVPFYWDIGLDGFADADNGDILRFSVSPEDRKTFPELGKRKSVKLRERDDGFVCEV